MKKKRKIQGVFQDNPFATVLNYLKLGKFKLGLLINFNVTRLKFGLQRVINDKGNNI